MTKDNNKNLVIVESPAKARTLANILGRRYLVKASVGHVRDLPKSRLGVDIAQGFAPRYVVPKEKRAVVRQIKEAAQEAATIYLATDPDREGEAISWHLVQAADLADRPLRRVVFHEITPEAVRAAFRHPHDIDMQLVHSQQARRILDRLVGYKISPLLWQKVRRGLSAGRVQSVALRLVVEREREIESFVPQEYWTIDADLAKVSDAAPPFRARLVGQGPKRQKLDIPSQEAAQALVQALTAAAYRVATIRHRQQRRRPPPPFITSTLQQEASRRLGFSPKRTMALAQQLYEGLPLGSQGEVGLITYMRTDSTRLAESARQEMRQFIKERFGQEYLPPAPRSYRAKVKGAQEAHEAIRPTAITREPEALRPYLNRDQLRLYTLIWQRALASQMADALYQITTLEIEARPPDSRHVYILRATATRPEFLGYRRLYTEATADDAKAEEEATALPHLTEGEELRLVQLVPSQHFTEPPPRYSEASLVKALEEKGIGRPSTYAPILATLQERGYVKRVDGRLQPQELGIVVNDLLTTYFPHIVDVRFTAQMEEGLDEIARGQQGCQQVVAQFYEPLAQALAEAAQAPPAQEVTHEQCQECGRPMIVRWGRFGRFLTCSGYPECQSSRPLGEEEPQTSDQLCPLCNTPMVVKGGRYGPFLACPRYPQCKGTRPLMRKTGARCPQCGGDIVERRSRGRRTFYGCANYPQCRFVTWAPPPAEPCPHCGGLLTSQGAQGTRCTNCGWQGEVPQRTAAGVHP